MRGYRMGYTALTSQALSAPPYLFAFVVMLLTARLSDRTGKRAIFVCFHAALAASGYALVALGGALRWSNTLRYLAVYPACAGFFSAITIIIAWTMNNQTSYVSTILHDWALAKQVCSHGRQAKRGTGMTILNLIGQCGPLLGTRLYPDSDAPYYVRGMLVCSTAMSIVFVLALVLKRVLARENEVSAREAAKQRGAQPETAGTTSNKSADDSADRFVLML